MTTFTEKLILTVIASIILSLSAWTCSAISNLKTELPTTYATKAELNRAEDFIESRLSRMACRIITAIQEEHKK